METALNTIYAADWSKLTVSSGTATGHLTENSHEITCPDLSEEKKIRTHTLPPTSVWVLGGNQFQTVVGEVQQIWHVGGGLCMGKEVEIYLELAGQILICSYPQLSVVAKIN